MFKVIDLVGFHVSITHEAHCHSQDSEHTHFPTVSLVTVDYFAFSRILYEWNHILYCVNSFRIFFRSPLVIMQLFFFKPLSSISLYGCTIICLCVHPFVDIWVVFRLGLLQVKLLWTYASFSFGKYIRVEQLDHVVDTDVTL